MSTQNDLAKHFSSLHTPGDPIIMINVWDAATALAALSNPSTKAIATASFAVAASLGKKDEELSFEENLSAIRIISSALVNQEAGDSSDGIEKDNKTVLKIPLSADLQDGYSDISETIRKVIKLGVVGANIEDVSSSTGNLRSVAEAVERIQQAKQAAIANNVPDFVINARTDTLLFGASVEDAIDRGKQFLEAGANTVFVWGGPKRGMSDKEVADVTEGLGGRVNVKMKLGGEGALRVRELKELGVARVSFGPGFFQVAMDAFKTEVGGVLGGV